MLVQIRLRDPGSAYSDNGISISGADPIILELSPFVCGLVYRGEADIFESAQDKINSKKEKDLDNIGWIELKKLAIDNGLDVTKHSSKKQLIEMLKGIMNVV